MVLVAMKHAMNMSKQLPWSSDTHPRGADMVPTSIRSGYGGPPKISGIVRLLRLFILFPPKQKPLGQFVFISWWMIFKPFMLSLSFKTETDATTEFNGIKQMFNFWCLFNWRKILIKFYFKSHLFCSIKVSLNPFPNIFQRVWTLTCSLHASLQPVAHH